jgi:hypothetical protein
VVDGCQRAHLSRVSGDADRELCVDRDPEVVDYFPPVLIETLDELRNAALL